MTDEIMTLRTLLEKSSDGYDRVSQPFLVARLTLWNTVGRSRGLSL